jgi:hypothetical protein
VAEVVSGPLELSRVEESARPELERLMLEIEDFGWHLAPRSPPLLDLVDDPSQKIDRLGLTLRVLEQDLRLGELLRQPEEQLVILRRGR